MHHTLLILVLSASLVFARSATAQAVEQATADIAQSAADRSDASGSTRQIRGVRTSIPTDTASADFRDISREVDRALAQAEKLSPRKSNEKEKKLRVNNDTRIVLRPGMHELIPIARNYANRIVTPFRNPEIVSTGTQSASKNNKAGECGEICVKGNVVYVSTNRESPISMFITEEGSEETALSVTMLPRNIPPREVFLELPAGLRANKTAEDIVRSNNFEAESFERSLPYVETLRTMMREVAQGRIPSGYTLGKTAGARNIPSCAQAGLAFNFKNGQRLTGHNLDIYVGVVTNSSGDIIEFDEMSCSTRQTAAVASWPLHVLAPGEKTEVYVVMKEARKPVGSTERTPLIRREYGYR